MKVIVDAHLRFKLEKAAFIFQLITVIALFDWFLSTHRVYQHVDMARMEETFQI